MTPLEQFLLRAEALLARLEAVLPPTFAREPDWKRSHAFRWRKRAGGGASYLQPVLHAASIALSAARLALRTGGVAVRQGLCGKAARMSGPAKAPIDVARAN